MGKTNSGSIKELVTFFLDECLPYPVAEVLHRVGYNIVSWHTEFNGEQGIKDPQVIQYLGGKRYTLITVDKEAKRKHSNDIRAAQISVVWIKGLSRGKSKHSDPHIDIKDLHRMLTMKLDEMAEIISKSKSPRYFTLRLIAGGKAKLEPISLEDTKISQFDI